MVNAQNSFQEKSVGKSKLVVTAYKSNWQGWATIGGKKCWFRSVWEHNAGCYFEWLKSSKSIYDWEHEPETFAFPKDKYKAGPFYYLPDYRIWTTPTAHHWTEIKGYMTKNDVKKHKRFAKHYPEETLVVFGAKEMKEIAKYRRMIPGWMYFQPQQ